MKTRTIIPAVLAVFSGGLIGACGLFFPAPADAQITFTQIAISGDDAPDNEGDPTGETFDWFADVVINASGSYAFRAGRTWSGGVDVDNDSGLWSDLGGLLRLIAMEGDDAPGTEDPIPPNPFAQFKEIIASGANPALSDSEHLVFRSRLFVGAGSAATTYSDFGVWLAEDGGLTPDVELVAREGDFATDGTGAPTGATFDLGRVFPRVSDGDGSVAFLSTLYVDKADSDATTKDRHGVWLWDNTADQLYNVARASALDDTSIDTAPGTTDKHFQIFSQPALDASGDLAFMGKLRSEPKLDDLGDPIPDRVTSKNASGLWEGDDVTLDLALIGGDSSGGGTFRFVYAPGTNVAGDIVFRARLLGGPLGAPRTEDTGIWLLENDGLGGFTLAQIAIEGSAAAGAGGAVFGNFRNDPIIANDGTVAFLTQLNLGAGGVDKDNDDGIWSGDALGLSLVAREEDVAYIDASLLTPIPPPSGSSDVRFGKLYSPSINQNGQVAFLAQLKSAPVGLTSAENRAIFAQRSTDNALLLVVRLGDTLAGKTVKGLSFVYGSGGGDGRPRAWVYNGGAGEGQLAFVASFTDGTSGVFIASVP